jgi:hypothetical protein
MLTLDDMKRIWNKLYRDTYRPELGGPCDKTLEGRHNLCGPCDKVLEMPWPIRNTLSRREQRHGEWLEITTYDTKTGELNITEASAWKPPWELTADDF